MIKDNLTRMREITDAIENEEVVYRCTTCDNLSLDRKNWVIFLDLPVVPETFSYVDDICDLCSKHNYTPPGSGYLLNKINK